jgi:hypothetical protein
LGFKKSIGAGVGITNLSQSAHIFANRYRALSSAVKMYQRISKEKDVSSESPTMSAEGLETVLETLWNIAVLDVESTLRSVCFKVLKDASVSVESRILRAEALIMISEIFAQSSQTVEKGLTELENQLKPVVSNLPKEQESP